MQVNTIEAKTTESGLIVKLREFKAAGQHTTCQVLTGRKPSDFGLVGVGLTYSQACDLVDWYMDGCLA
jgi:hypothetical protein